MAHARERARSHAAANRRSPFLIGGQAEHAPRTHISVARARAGRQTVSAADVSPQFGIGHCADQPPPPKNAASAALVVSPRHSPTSAAAVAALIRRSGFASVEERLVLVVLGGA